MNPNLMLQVAGVCAIVVALYHGVVGDALFNSLEITPSKHKPLMRGSFHIGTTGWLAGGLVLLFVSTLDQSFTRTAIVITYAVMFGIPAAGQVVMSRGRPNFGMVMLILVVLFALLGR